MRIDVRTGETRHKACLIADSAKGVTVFDG
jgi:hypothetical protein